MSFAPTTRRIPVKTKNPMIGIITKNHDKPRYPKRQNLFNNQVQKIM